MGYPTILYKFGVQIEGFIVVVVVGGGGGGGGGGVCVCVCLCVCVCVFVCVWGGWRGRLPCGAPSGCLERAFNCLGR